MTRENFFNDVYEVVRLVPEGRATSYGAIANYLGLKSSARMVGWAMNSCFGDPTIPAHRVVNRVGVLTGKSHFPTQTAMEEALRKEGIKVKDDKIEDFDLVFWDPNKELSI
ncbi:MAG: MGMT family protein [Bacteroidota bacterium]